MRTLKTVLLLLFVIAWSKGFAQLSFSLSQSTIACGEQTCLQVTTRDFANILTFQYSINWDEAVLGNASVQNFGIADLSDANFNLTTNGIARIGWDDSSVSGVNLANDAVIFEICFDEIGNNTTTSTVQFSGNPIAIEVVDIQGQILDANFEDGTVEIDCSNSGDGGTTDGDGNMDEDSTNTSEALSFFINQATANCGDQICLDVRVNGFADISSFQYSLNWDADLLGIASVQQFGLPDMDQSHFNATTSGILRVGYDDSGLTGRNLIDSSVLFQVCYDLAADATGTSSIDFSNNPIAIEAVDVQGNILVPTLQNGVLSVSCEDTSMPMDTTPLPLGFVISTETVNCGNQVCLDVSVQGFTDITFFRYSMAWDFQVLGGETIESANLDNLRFGPIAPGTFWTEWRDPSNQGVTLDDNEILYRVCFDALGNSENSTDIEFTNVPIPVQVLGIGNVNLRPELQNGEVVVTCIPEVIDTPDSLAFALNTVDANCGDQVCLSVTAQDFNDIFSFQYSLIYDDAALGAAQIQNIGLEGMSESNFNTTTAGIVLVGWDDASLQGISIPDNSVLFDLCFDVASDASGDIGVNFSDTPLPIEVVDVAGNILVPNFQNGVTNINCDSTEPVDTTTNSGVLKFAISDGSVNCGEQICMDVISQNFDNLLSFQYSIIWDATILGTATIQQFNLDGLGAANFNAEIPGILRVGWADPSVQGITMAEDAVLYQICFNAIGNETTNAVVQFSDNPLPTEILNGASEIIEAQFQDGNVTVACTVVEPPVDTTQSVGDNLTFVLSETSGDCGETVCMNVTVHNFDDILSYQYSINWDANLLGQASVQGYNMPDLGAANFNASTPGVIRVGWDDSFITGVTLPDNQMIYQICFDNVNEAIDNFPIVFSGTPTSIEVVNDQSNFITPDFINGNLSITCDNTGGGNNGGNPTNELGFQLSQTTGNCGEQICTDVSVSGFSNVLSFQYSIIWDAATLGTANVQSFGIPDINNSNFNNNTAGILRIGWDDTFITGVTLPDNHIIFQVCFDAVETSIENAVLNFSDTPTSIEVVDRDGQFLMPTFQSGSVNVNCDAVGPIDNDGDGFDNIIDCDDNNPNVNTSATEIPNNGIDEDCDGQDLITIIIRDDDGDGFGSDVDCDDNNPIIYPGAMEFPNNNVDEDCDGIALFIDADNDGWNSSIDCDDNNPNVNGHATEIPNNGIDEDCNGADLITTTPTDNDGDGFESDVDCDDNNPNIYPGAMEFPNNNVDEDCDGIALFIDADNDGWNSSIDCDDNNPNINGNATEIPNNGIDEDCDGQDLVDNTPTDADNDGFNSDNDCDDNNPNINPNATEIANNGIDEDCNGVDLVENVPTDADNDGFNSDTDCDDNNPNINPNATEIPNNGIDEDCNGADLIIDDNAVTFALSMESVNCGDQVCLNASVRNFTDLISFQYSLTWDTAVLNNVSTQAFNLEGLNGSAFFNPQNGVMRVSWFDTQVRGISVADDQIIFQLCFDVTSNTATATTVQFSNNPIPIEVIDNQSNEMMVNMVEGAINITNCSGILIGETNQPTKAGENENPNLPSIIQFSNIDINQQNILENIQVYPNPTNQYINIVLENPLQQDGIIRLFNIHGQLLKTVVILEGQNKASVNLNEYPNGIYLFEIHAANKVSTKRVVKQ